MEKPINFLTARGDDLFDYFYSLRIRIFATAQSDYATSYRAFVILRDEIAAAVEAKVRGECAEDIEAIRCKYDEAVADFLHAKARAERAEAERDEAYSEIARIGRLPDPSDIAEYKRVAAYGALTKLADKFVVDWGLKKVNTIRKFRDSLYAPTPARSVMPVVNVSDFYDASAVIIRPEQARAIVALAQEAR
jgi:hypothetical protein